MSATPPGGNGTTSEIGFAGYVSCAIAAQATTANIRPAMNALAGDRTMVSPLLRNRAFVENVVLTRWFLHAQERLPAAA